MRSTAARRSSSRDARELALDDDVADGQQAAGLDAAERADREERRRLHLDGEHAALRPALVLPLVRVVEEVARDDRADVQLLARSPSPCARRRG